MFIVFFCGGGVTLSGAQGLLSETDSRHWFCTETLILVDSGGHLGCLVLPMGPLISTTRNLKS